ncbi:MAG: sulfatase-like hydrolase/transferase [Opitutaceae bacterium]|nr:sulfatase-like hydrolase/transferase [Opitutaceae bacterium]
MSRASSILWILTTQWRAHATGYAGDPNARTPGLDALARAAVNYRQAVTPHPFGPFARAALLTGVPCPANGVRDYFDPLPSSARTVAHALGERGYRTAYFGKWHLGKRDPLAPLVGEAHARTHVPPESRGGFAFWEGFESGFLLNDPWLHGTRLPEPTRFSGYQSDVVCSRAANWLSTADVEQPESPWFAVVSLEAPHPPYAAPAAGVKAPAPDSLVLRDNVPRGGELETRVRSELSGYYAQIEATDRAITRLLETLRWDTIVVFTSVHGDMHGAHGLLRKGWPHEESVRVPLLVRGAPGPRRAGAVSDEPVSLLDLPVMTAAWAEGQAWRCLRDYAALSMPSVVALPHQCDRVWQGNRSASHKMIFKADGTPWLDFDLVNDPLELTNKAEGFSVLES